MKIKKFQEDSCFSVIFINRQFLNKSIDFLAENRESKTIFVTALRHLINKHIIERLNFDEKRWVTDKFDEADRNKNGKLTFDEIWSILKAMNLQLSKAYAKKMFMVREIKGSDRVLDREEFFDFFSRLTDSSKHREILTLFSCSGEPVFNISDLQKFLIDEQQFSNIDEKKCESIIEEFEQRQPDELEENSKVLGPLGLYRLLQSSWGSIIKQEHAIIFQNMNLPLNHYYINSSHNTYLTGLQMKGEASVEGYISALQKGARLLELDVFNGENGEPCITHKRTLIASITLRHALQVINKYAFKNNPYPIILTIENHVGLPQQKAMARIFHEVLGDKIYFRPENGANIPLPSPNALKNKYLLRGKKLPGDAEPDKEFDQDADELPDDENLRKSITLHPEFSRLISLPSVKLSDNLYQDIEKHPLDGSPSLSESKVASFMEGGTLLANYTASRLVKSYPMGLRLDSSNMNPLPSWICGVQCVAMNMQTCCENLDLVNGLFRINGNCGYVLKPDIVSGHYLPKTQPGNDVIDPYVTVEFYGIPPDCKKFKTKSIRNNGFNPTWNETFITVVHYPEFAFMRLCVKDFDSTSANDFVGEYTVPIDSIRPGYSHVRLNTGFDHSIDESASLLVRIAFE
ncbi:unnamed protein product [Dracunculus medinensis]|uniref:Phosphoinositide phospholipase C n=1 Tax=Dracunculus medinensis TaxID=318479 RepID=A0A0N4UIW4_DRAME|nr:unnamed protein product [Dracunculus medinensis]